MFLSINSHYFSYLRWKRTNLNRHPTFKISSSAKYSNWSLLSPSKTHRLSFPHRVLLYVVHWPLCPAINREFLLYINHIIDNHHWQLRHDLKLTPSSSVSSAGSCMKMRFFCPSSEDDSFNLEAVSQYKWQRLTPAFQGSYWIWASPNARIWAWSKTEHRVGAVFLNDPFLTHFCKDNSNLQPIPLAR